jgi:heme A synthase
MIYLLVLLPATALTVAGYVALFLSARSEGVMRRFGKYLGYWAFTLAGLLVLGTMFATAQGGHHCPIFGMHGTHERMPNPTEAPTAPPPAPPR